MATVAVLAGLALTASGGTVETWSGDVELDRPIVVPDGETLVLEEGTTVAPSGATNATLVVRGGLLVDGSAREPVSTRVPVRMDGQSQTPFLIQNATLDPSLDPSLEASCALAVDPDRAGRVENASIRASTNGLCLQPMDIHQEPPEPTGSGQARETEEEPSVPPLPTADLVPRGAVQAEGADGTEELDSLTDGLSLRSVRLEDNRNTGLNLTPNPSDDAQSVRAAHLTVVDNGVGIRTAEGAPHLEIQDATIARNDVGIQSSGGQVRLDHATFRDNDRWDIHQTRDQGDVRWTQSSFEPTCSHVEGRPAHGCHRGAIPASTLTLIVGLVYSLLFLVSEAGRYLLVRVGMGLGLFSRIPREELLDDETRQRLVELIRSEPGLHLREIQRRLDAGYGQVAYHLNRLEDENFIDSQREGLYRRFYAGQADPEDRPKRSTRDEVLEAIRNDPGTHAAEIARELRTSRQLVSYHVRELVGLAKVEELPGKNCKRLFPLDP